ncbi:unnamed protein product [Acanthosepion pharaonis]|uniref:DUF7041 domain-containing protein n=1 Tax=Acanthosepion pharaonis TaxID=158019 RepID=A0A812B0H6_ACAPH|nr:unnamed protein product [Sepia pharaonis]
MATDEWGTEHSHKCGNATHKPPSVQRAEHQELVLQLEAIFSVRKITSQQAKFVNVVQVLPPSVVDEVADILEHVPEQEPYTRLKDAILKRTGRSDEELLRELLPTPDAGDRRLATESTEYQQGSTSRPGIMLVPSQIRHQGKELLGTLQIQLQNQVGKLNSRRVGVAEPRQKHTKPPFLRMGPTEQHKVSSGHRSSYQRDTPKEQQDRKATPYKLQAANGSTIETYGAKTLTLNIGMRRDFTWTFTQADVKTPILGADFLAHYDLAVHMNTRTLSDNTTNIAVKGTLSRHNTTGISVTTCHGREYIEILNRYSDLIQPLAGTGPARHQTQHHIKTSGQPTFSHPRRLPPHKLEYAQKEAVRPPHQQQPRPAAAAARASRAVRPPHQQQQQQLEPAEQSGLLISSSQDQQISAAAYPRQHMICTRLPSCDPARHSTQGRTEYTTALSASILSLCKRRRTLYSSTDIQGSTGPRTSLFPFGLPPSCRLET